MPTSSDAAVGEMLSDGGGGGAGGGDEPPPPPHPLRAPAQDNNPATRHRNTRVQYSPRADTTTAPPALPIVRLSRMLVIVIQQRSSALRRSYRNFRCRVAAILERLNQPLTLAAVPGLGAEHRHARGQCPRWSLPIGGLTFRPRVASRPVSVGHRRQLWGNLSNVIKATKDYQLRTYRNPSLSLALVYPMA
jgi:hypothetical protein